MNRGDWREHHQTLYWLLFLIRQGLPTQAASYSPVSTIVPRAPGLLNVETTNLCNLSCVMCQTNLSRRPRGYMDLALYRKVLGSAREIGIPKVTLFTVGEPFMGKEIGQHMQIAQEYGLPFFLSTNGQLLTSEHIENLIEFPPSRIQFSVDGATKETYGKVRRGGSFTRLIDNLSLLRSSMQKANLYIPVTIHVTILEENIQELLLFFDVFKDFVGGIHNINFLLPDTLSASEGKTYFESLGCQTASKIPCAFLWSTPSVLWDGRVSACCRDFHGELIMGNVLEESLLDIWHGEKYESLRRKHLSGDVSDVPLCNECFSAGTLSDSWKINAYLHLVYTNKLRFVNRLLERTYLYSFRQLLKKVQSETA